METGKQEVYRAHQGAQERFAYFFLAASGSAIAFALVRTEGQPWAIWMLPVGAAVVCWGFSFYSGCQHVLYRTAILAANLAEINVREGTHPLVGSDRERARPALEGIREAVESNQKRAREHGRSQYRLFLFGAAFYVLGHILRLLTW